jgi:hypothetical protein
MIFGGEHGDMCFCSGCCGSRNAILAMQAAKAGDNAEAHFRGRLADDQLRTARENSEG